jgi:hypothetical protein
LILVTQTQSVPQELRGEILRLQKRSIVPIGVIALVALGTSAVEANPVGHRASYGVAGQDGQVLPHPVTSQTPQVIDPVIDPAPPVDPTVSPVVDPATPSVYQTTAFVRPPKTAFVRPPTTTSGASGATPTPTGSRGPAPVSLGAASAFAILTGTGITDVYASRITGNVGASPITGAAIGLTCPEVTGTIYSVNAGGPLACRVTNAPALTQAVGDEGSAYTDAAGRPSPDFVNLGAGQIGGRTLAPGLYKWSTGVLIPTSITLAGGPNDVWIFQIAGPLTQASGTTVRLAGGARARNIFWQSAGAVTLGAGAHSEGTILSKTMIALTTGASSNGRLLAQTAVTLQQNRVTIAQ